MATSAFTTIQATSLVEQCYEQIKSKILNGEISGGAPLSDYLLARQMGVSRSPVREALRLLEPSGLVRKSTNRSYRVVEISNDDVDELAALRLADEGLAVALIVRRRTPIDSLKPLLDGIASAPPGSVAAADADTAFHAAVVNLARLPRLSARHSALADQIRLMLMVVGLPRTPDQKELWQNHVELYDALQRAINDGSTSRVLALWEAHVAHGMYGEVRPIPATRA